MARPVKVVHVGLGPIGQGIARLVAETDGLQIVGATDPFPDHAGKDLGPLLGLSRRLRVKVEGSPERFFRRARADVAVLSTSSTLKTVKGQVAALVQRGCTW
jgi:4-hydroxy-tetrahydrodipicolinate reductase